jgi:hypothetical protein
LGDVWSILVLANYSAARDRRHLQPVLHLHPCFQHASGELSNKTLRPLNGFHSVSATVSIDIHNRWVTPVWVSGSSFVARWANPPGRTGNDETETWPIFFSKQCSYFFLQKMNESEDGEYFFLNEWSHPEYRIFFSPLCSSGPEELTMNEAILNRV